MMGVVCLSVYSVRFRGLGLLLLIRVESEVL